MPSGSPKRHIPPVGESRRATPAHLRRYLRWALIDSPASRGMAVALIDKSVFRRHSGAAEGDIEEKDELKSKVQREGNKQDWISHVIRKIVKWKSEEKSMSSKLALSDDIVAFIFIRLPCSIFPFRFTSVTLTYIFYISFTSVENEKNCDSRRYHWILVIQQCYQMLRRSGDIRLIVLNYVGI